MDAHNHLDPAPVAVSDRVLSVLALFVGERAEWTLHEAASALAIPTSTAYRYFRSLAAHGLIYDHLPGRYVLGAAVMMLDRQMRLHDPLIEIVAPSMHRLVEAIDRPCVVLLARLFRDAVMCVHRLNHRDPVFSVSYERGRMMPLDRGATSKVILAHLPIGRVRRLMQSRPQPAAHDAALRRIRAEGYCVAAGEVDPGRVGVAVPIILPHRRQVASLSVVLETEGGDVIQIAMRLGAERRAIESSLQAGAKAVG